MTEQEHRLWWRLWWAGYSKDMIRDEINLRRQHKRKKVRRG